MGFFEDLGKSFNKASRDISKRAKNMSTINKLNTEISKAKREIHQETLNIGNAVIEKKDAKYKEFTDKIDAAKALIEEDKKKVLALKGVVVCQSCGTEASIDAAYCGKCGAELVKPEIPVEEEPEPVKTNPCPDCGEDVPLDSEFCPSCGAKVAK